MQVLRNCGSFCMRAHDCQELLSQKGGDKGYVCCKCFPNDLMSTLAEEKVHWRGSAGGSAAKNLPADTGDTGSIPDPGRSRMPQSNEAHVPQLLRLCSTARELQLLKPLQLGAHVV